MKKLSYSPDYKDKLILLKQDLDIKYGQPVRRKVFSEINHRIQLLKSNPHLGISVRDTDLRSDDREVIATVSSGDHFLRCDHLTFFVILHRPLRDKIIVPKP